MATNYNPYQKKTWVNNETKLNETNLNNIEIAISENRENSIDVKLLLQDLASALQNNCYLSYNSSTKMLTLSIGGSQNNISTSTSTKIDLTAAALAEVTTFLNQVATAYHVYDNILDYTKENNILASTKISEGIVTADIDCITYSKIDMDDFVHLDSLPQKLYISTTSGSSYPIYSITFYNAQDSVISYLSYPTGEVSIPDNTQYISVTLYTLTHQNTRVGLTEISSSDYLFYKVNPGSIQGLEKLQYIDVLRSHVLNQNNPHNITKEILDIDEIYDGDNQPPSTRFKTWLQSEEENDIIDLEVDDTNTLVASSPDVNTLVADEEPQSMPVSNDGNTNTLVS